MSLVTIGHPDWQPFGGVPQELAVSETVTVPAGQTVDFFIGDVSTHGVVHGAFSAQSAGKGVDVKLHWLSRSLGVVLAEHLIPLAPARAVEFSLPVLSPVFRVQLTTLTDTVQVTGTLFASSANAPFGSPRSFLPLVTVKGDPLGPGQSIDRIIGRGKRGFLYLLAMADVGGAIVTEIKEQGSDLINRTFYLVKHPLDTDNIMRLPWHGAAMVLTTTNESGAPHNYDLYVWIGE